MMDKVAPIYKILDKLKQITQGDLQIDYWYLVALIKEDRYFDALDYIRDLKQKYDFLDERFICFMYLEAEIKFKLKRYDEAFSIFKRIDRIDPRYRLVKERINEISQI